MLRIMLAIALLAAGLWWLFGLVLSQPGNTTIAWGGQLLEMKTATLVLGVLLVGVLFYMVLRSIVYLAGLPKRLAVRRQQKLAGQSAESLTQGLIQLAEGHWSEAEQQLTQHVAYSKTPLLNYLTAARAAHMQQKPEQRDELLRRAIASDSQAQIAVGVSQAEMQLSDAQLEQAHATLLNLRKLAPKNSYVLKLYAKTLFRQKHWEQLLELMPELLQHDLLDKDSKNMQQLKVATLRGVFAKCSDQQQDASILQGLWQKIPAAIAKQAATKLLYANALHQAGAEEVCAAFITQNNAAVWDEKLTGLYGKLQHADLSTATQQARQWLAVQPENPVNLLLLARLYRQQQQWETAKTHYVTSLNQTPDAEAYLELAEMLEGLGQFEAATQCYRAGLRYNIRAEGERLVFAVDQPPLKVAGQ